MPGLLCGHLALCGIQSGKPGHLLYPSLVASSGGERGRGVGWGGGEGWGGEEGKGGVGRGVNSVFIHPH